METLKSGQPETDISKEQLLATVQEASRLASSIYSSVTNLSRSAAKSSQSSMMKLFIYLLMKGRICGTYFQNSKTSFMGRRYRRTL